MRKTIYLFVFLFLGSILYGCKGGETKKLTLPKDNITINVGETYEVDYTLVGNDSISFEVVNPDVLSITEDGVIKGLKAGETKVILKAGNLMAELKVTVKQRFTITAPETLTLHVGDVSVLEFSTTDSKSVSFEVSDSEVLNITPEGKITAKKVGEATVILISKTDTSIKKEVKVTVLENVYLNVNDTFSVDFDEEKQLVVDTNYTRGLSYIIEDKEVISITEEGLVKGLKIGTTTVKVSPKDYPNLFKTITITVNAPYNMSAPEMVEVLVGEEYVMDFTADTDVYLVSEDTTIATVNDIGKIKGLKLGETNIKIITNLNENIFLNVKVRVVSIPTSIKVNGKTTMNVETTQQLTFEFNHPLAHTGVIFTISTISDESVLSVDEKGLVNALAAGTSVITVTSETDNNLKDTIEITVYNEAIVSKEATENMEFDGVIYVYGKTLFNTITEAIEKSKDNVVIKVLEGIYTEDLTILKPVHLVGYDAVIDGFVKVSTNNVSVEGFTFSQTSFIENTLPISNLKVIGNTITTTKLNHAFITLDKVSDSHIRDNIIDITNQTAIDIKNPMDGLIQINGNVIKNALVGIKLISEVEYQDTLEVGVGWNKISNTKTAFDLNPKYASTHKNIVFNVRFNEVTGYEKAVQTVSNHNIDFTLNYWGKAPDLAEFSNITTDDLKGYYVDANLIISEENFDPNIPIIITITNEIEEFFMDQQYSYEYELLPKETPHDTVQWITSSPNVARVVNNEIVPIRSGEVTFTLRAKRNYNINAKTTLTVVTTPGIELEISKPMGSPIVGEDFSFIATPFPKKIENEAVLFETDDTSIATIDQNGNVTSLKAGLVTITASLQSDPTVTQSFKVEIVDAYEDDNLMDLLTQYANSYATRRIWTVYGVSYNYTADTNDSVNRYLFGGIGVINRDRILPISEGLRPGLKKPVGTIPSPNSQNIYYIVFHETAGTNTNAGALSYSNYLWNQYHGNTKPFVSWTYTLDDKVIYQHIPDDEVAYHAGDGSTLAGTTWTDKWGNTHMGGGNRNGIGIETSVADDHDTYKVWHRVAKFGSMLAKQYNLPRENFKYHFDFSGKSCPQSLLKSGYAYVYQEMVDIEYKIIHEFEDWTIDFQSHNPEYIDNSGRVIKQPDRAITVSYTVTLTKGAEVITKTFYMYLPGTVH